MKKNGFNNFIIIFVSVIAVAMIILEKDIHISRLLQLLAIIPIMLIPKMLRHVFKTKFPTSFELLYLVFLVLAYFLGVAFNFYGKFLFYDKFVHFLSGFMTSFLALFLLVKMKKYDRKSILYNIIFILLVTLAVACLWEMFEFTCDLIFERDAQKVITTGVSDTMEDMISAFLASILFVIAYIFEMINQSKGFFTTIIKSLE